MIETEEIPHIINMDDLKELQLALAEVDAEERKPRVLFHSLWYPMAIAQYFRRALELREDIDLKTVGITTGNWIPWKGGMNVPQKYAYTPDIPLPYHFSNPIADYDYVKTLLLWMET